MLEISHLSKTYSKGLVPKRIQALRDLSLSVQPGEVYAFVGPNGAGKTTTIKAILGIISVDRGSIRINRVDHRRKEARRWVGYLPDQPYFYDHLTVNEYLTFSGQLYGLSRRQIRDRLASLIPQVGLEGRESQRLRSLSRGLLQRVGMAQALLHDPLLLILDEPLTGLDPVGRKELRDLILQLKSEGKTIFFSSHILADAELISDRVGILHRGRLVREMALHELTAEGVFGLEITFRMSSEQIGPPPNRSWQVESFDHHGLLRVDSTDQIYDAIHWVERSGAQLVSVTPRRKTLEDIFLEEMRQ